MTRAPSAKAGAKAGAVPTVVSLEVTLRGIKPSIWRRLLIPGTMTLGALHNAIQGRRGVWRKA